MNVAIRTISGIILLALLAPQAFAQVRGVSYTLAPEAGRLYFDRNAGLADDYFYGGMLGFGFGEFVELSARYSWAPTVRRDLSDIGGVTDAVRQRLLLLPERDITLRTYGGVLRLNLGTGGIVPFVKAGTGIMDIAGDDLNRSRLIYATGGGGLQITASDRYAISIGAENLTYRQNLGATLFTNDDLDASGLVPLNFRTSLVHNWAASVALKAYLGGIAPGSETDVDRELRQQLEGGLRGLRMIVEPFYGVIDFNEELAFASSQNMGGIYAGIDMGQYVGLRAFYWRGMPTDEIAFQDLQAYGAELRLAFGTGNFAPYFAIGGGYMDPLEEYEGREGLRPSGEPFVMGGAGISVPLSDRIDITGGLRLLVMSSEAVDNVSAPSDIYMSPMFSGGVRFALGGRRPDVPLVTRPELEDDLQDLDPMQAEIRRLRARIDSLERGRAVTDPAAIQPAVIDEEGRIIREGTARSYRSNQMVTIPVPEEGEIYIRYGPPAGTVTEARPTGQAGVEVAPGEAPRAAGLSPVEIQQIVRETIRAELATAEVGATDAGAMARLEQRMNDQLDRLQIQLQQQLRTRPADPLAITVDSRVRGATLIDNRGVRAVTPFTGFTLGSATSFNLGVRADYRGDFLSFLTWYPELIFGFGTGGYSYNLNMTGAYRVDFIRAAAPYVGLGFGILGFNDSPEDLPGIQFLVNTVIGSDFTVGRTRVFAEYMLMDFGDFHRYSVGLRYAF